MNDQCNKNLKVKVVRGAVWSLVQGWGTQFGSLFIFFLLARLLTPEAFGLVALASVFLAFMQAFLSQGFADALVQRDTLESEHLDAAFYTNLFLGIGLMILGISTSYQVANFFATPSLSSVIRGLSPLLLVNSLSSVHQAQLQRQFAFKALAIRNLLGTMSGGIAGIFMALNGWGVWALVGQQLVQESVATVVLWRSVDWTPTWKFSFKHWQDLLCFGLNQLAFNLLGFCNNRADDFLIGYYLDPVSLGYYSLSYRILTMLTNLLINASNQVALPTFSRLKGDLERFRTTFYQATKFSSALAFPVFAGIGVLASDLITTLFGKSWMPSVPVLQVLVIVGALRSVTYFKSSIFLAMDKPDWRLRLGCLSSTLNVIGFFVAVRWGIVAVSLAYLARALIVFPISQTAVSKLINTPLWQYLQQFTSSIVSVGLTVAVMIGMRVLVKDSLGSTLTILCTSAIGAGIYGLAMYRFEPKLLKQVWTFLFLASKKPKLN